MKKLLVIGALCFILLGSPAVSLAQTLTLSQLQAIVASLQAQLNALIAQLNLIQQQGNNSKPIERIKPSLSFASPKAGDQWVIGQVNKIYFNGRLPLNSQDCNNTLNLVDRNGKTVGKLSLNGAVVTWDTKYLSTSICEGDKMNIIVQPGRYKFQAVSPGVTGLEVFTESSYFNLVNSSTSQPSITVTSPNGGETLMLGNNIIVHWSAVGAESFPGANLQLLDLNGKMVSWSNINPISGNNKSDNLTTNGLAPAKYLVKACLSGNIEVCDTSDNYFTITNSATPSLKSSLKVTVLNGAAQCFRAPCEVTLPSAVVQIFNDKGVLVDKKTATGGYVLFTNLNPGTYIVLASAPGVSSRETRLGLVSGQNSEIKMTLGGFGAQAPTDSQLAAVLQSLKGVLSGLSGSLTP